MHRINKNTVKKIIRNTGHWEGYLAPCKVNASHVIGWWYIGSAVSVTSIDELNEYINNYTVYNCNYELGYYTVLWTK